MHVMAAVRHAPTPEGMVLPFVLLLHLPSDYLRYTLSIEYPITIDQFLGFTRCGDRIFDRRLDCPM